jgi:hypothetical protein
MSKDSDFWLFCLKALLFFVFCGVVVSVLRILGILPPLPMLQSSTASNPQPMQTAPIQPYEHVYDIVIKEKFIVCTDKINYGFRYWNKTNQEHYMSWTTELENSCFLKFDVGEPLIFYEKFDGTNYDNKVVKASEWKAEQN